MSGEIFDILRAFLLCMLVPVPGQRSPCPADRSGGCMKNDIGAMSSSMHTIIWKGFVRV